MGQNVVPIRPALPVLKFHPLSEVFPLMEGTEFEDLVASIRIKQREDIILYEGMILDGRNRYRACIEAGKVPNVKTLEEAEGEDADPRKYVADKNLLRRHLTTSQRAMYMAQLATCDPGRPWARRAQSDVEIIEEKINGPKEPFISLTNAEAGAMALVSASSIKDAKVVLKDGTDEEKQNILNGSAGLRPTADQIRARQPKTASPMDTPTPVLNSVSSDQRSGGLIGARLVPPTNKTISQWCQEGMAFEDTGKGTEQAAKLIGMSNKSYREVRDIVLLATRVELTEKDRQQANDALRLLDQTRMLSRSYEMVRPIAERFWGHKGQRHGAENWRLEEFEDSIAMIVSVSMKARELTLPYLTEERSRDIIRRLKDGRSSLTDLVRMLEEFSK